MDSFIYASTGKTIGLHSPSASLRRSIVLHDSVMDPSFALFTWTRCKRPLASLRQ